MGENLHQETARLNDLHRLTREAREGLEVVEAYAVPAKSGLQSAKGQARLLHDLANIELQAIELGLRTLREFPDAPEDFRAALEAVTCEEGLHFQLCIEGIKDLGFKWGQWPIHTRLNDAVASTDTLLDRIFIVHCYLEGSGLDAGEILLRRLSGVRNERIQRTVERIVRDELKHVSFGVTWFREIAEQQGLNSETAMLDVIDRLRHDRRLPARGAALAQDVRLQAGFSHEEIAKLQQVMLAKVKSAGVVQ
jgi:uncharacterized ferritin-like protein (DUF455 family)